MPDKPPNVVLVFADQWRAQAFGYAGDPNVQTPNLDALASRSINCTHAVSGCSVCSPARASLLTGQYPLTHGVFVNDVELGQDATSIAQAFSTEGYDTAYIGKWHVNGRGRASYIPPERRQGFEYWKVLECTPRLQSFRVLCWRLGRATRVEGYDALAQTRDAQAYLRGRGDKPFLLALSWGPPHAPYHTAPEEYQALYDPGEVVLRPNVPADWAENARQWLAGYYAHCTALDDCVGLLLQTLQRRDWRRKRSSVLLGSRRHARLAGHGQKAKALRRVHPRAVPAALSRAGRGRTRRANRPAGHHADPIGPVRPADSLYRRGHRLFRVPTRRPRPFGRQCALAVSPSLWAVVDRRRRAVLSGPTHPPPHVRPRPRRAVAALRQRGRSLPTGQPRRPARPAGFARHMDEKLTRRLAAADDPFLPAQPISNAGATK